MTAQIVKSLDDVAKATGLSRRQLIRLRHQGMPGDTGAYDLDAVNAWLRAREGSKSNEQAEDSPPRPGTGKYWRAEKDKFASLKLALTVQEMRGETFTKDDVRRLFMARVNALRTGLLALPRIIAVDFPEVPGLESAVAARVHKMLDAYAQDNVIALLEQWRRQSRSGVKLGRGRGRPRGS